MTEALPPCPYEKRGQHDLNVVVPESDDHPMILFCIHCGMTARHAIAVPAPLDDLTAADIARIAKG